MPSSTPRPLAPIAACSAAAALSLLLAAGVSVPARCVPVAAVAARPRCVVRPAAVVTSDFITLGDIAEISPSPRASKASARLAATVVGRSPVPGDARPLTRGDIALKLRQAGIDPVGVTLAGAASLVVSRAAPSDPAAPAIPAPSAAAPSLPLPATPSAPAPAPAPLAVRDGDSVEIVLVDGPVTVRAKGVALAGGRPGDTIEVRRDDASRPLTVQIIDTDQVQLEE